MTLDTCGYHERNRDCHKPPVYEVRVEGKDLLLCERHVKPEFWPPDLRNRLPGRLKRLAVAITRKKDT